MVKIAKYLGLGFAAGRKGCRYSKWHIQGVVDIGYCRRWGGQVEFTPLNGVSNFRSFILQAEKCKIMFFSQIIEIFAGKCNMCVKMRFSKLTSNLAETSVSVVVETSATAVELEGSAGGPEGRDSI